MRSDAAILVTASRQYRAITPAAYAQVHREALAQLFVSEGVIVSAHDDPTARAARINYGRWLVDCACGAGALADPLFVEARCFHCGAVMHPIAFPPIAERAQLELLILRRPVEARHWDPRETTAEVAALNAAHGV